MGHRIAFVGFRHPHVFDMYQRCRSHSEVEIVACCEEDEETREKLSTHDDLQITHNSWADVLQNVPCDIVAVGDCYGRRADILVAAIESGKHVISDKPLCISVQELDRIEQAAVEHRRVVGCMLDMRDLPVFLGIRQLIRAGEIGEVQAISFDGQHPLLYGQRPMWYFESGMHGGVLNDIAVHAVDMIPWATGHRLAEVLAARGWNASVPQHPDFQQCGQAMFTLQNGAGVICDVSYLIPDSFAYEMPLYWRFTFWGTEGVLEATANSPGIHVYKNGEVKPRVVELPEGRPGAYLESFLRETTGDCNALHLSSADVLLAARDGLRLQQAADAE